MSAPTTFKNIWLLSSSLTSGGLEKLSAASYTNSKVLVLENDIATLSLPLKTKDGFHFSVNVRNKHSPTILNKRPTHRRLSHKVCL